jgi:hypothetical protein
MQRSAYDITHVDRAAQDSIRSGKIKFNPKAFGDWLESLPESENVKDRRHPEVAHRGGF